MSNNFLNAWSLGPNDLVAIEIAASDMAANPNIGTYGYRTIGMPSVTATALGQLYLAYLSGVDADAGRADCEVLTILQAPDTNNPINTTHYRGVAARASGAAGSEVSYLCYIDPTYGLVIGVNDAAVYGSGVLGLATYLPPGWPTNGEDWYIRFRVTGANLQARTWRYDQPEPSAWQLSVTESSISAPGHVGFFCLALSAGAHVSFGSPGFLSVGTSGEPAPRPLSEREQKAWLNDDSNPRVLLAEIGVLGADSSGVTAVPSIALVSNHPYVTQGADVPQNQVYDDVMIGVPTFTADVPDTLLGSSKQAYGDVIIKNENGVRDDWLSWNWDGRSFDLYMGGVGWRRFDFVKVAAATVTELYVPKKDQIGLKIADKSALLNRKIQPTTIGGTGPNAGAPKPITFGHVFNIEPVSIDAATLRYKFHDESLQAGAIGAVRDSGVTAAYTDVGGGEFTLTTSPTGSGRITMDVQGTTSAGSSTRVGNRHNLLIQTLVEDRAGFGVGATYQGLRAGSLANFGADPTDEIGFYLPGEMNFMDALDAASSSAGGFWYFNRLGLVCAALLRLPTAPYDYDLIEDDIEDFKIEKIILPSEAQQLGYQKNYTPQSDGLAGAVSVANRALYAAPAQYTTVVPTYSGLDQPANHQMRQRPRNRDGLMYAAADANAEVTRLDLVFRKTCLIVSFLSKYNAIYYNLGESLNLTYPRYCFTNGKAGVIVGLQDTFENASCRVKLFVQLDGQFPTTSSTVPYVGVQDFY